MTDKPQTLADADVLVRRADGLARKVSLATPDDLEAWRDAQ